MEEHFPYRRIKKPPRMQCWLDGKFHFVTNPIFTLSDWQEAMRSGFYFEMRAYACDVPYFGRYYQYLKDCIEENGYPDLVFLEKDTLRKVVRDLLQKDRYHENAIVRLTCFVRYAADAVEVARAQTSLLVEAFPIEGKLFNPDPPARMTIASFVRRRFTPEYVGISRPLVDDYGWQCERFCQRFTHVDGVYYNTHGRVTQTSRRDIYCIDQQTILTPPIAEGLHYDPFREIVQILAMQTGYRFVEEPLTREDVQHADELFLGSTRYGIEPIYGFDGLYYATYRGRRLIPELNRILYPNHYE